MSSFWGAEVKPGKPYTHAHNARLGRLRLTQATLGGEDGKGGKKVVQLQCTVKNKDPIFLCALVPGQSETCHLELEFEEKYVTFSVLGPRSVHLAGYYLGEEYGDEMDDSDSGSDSLRGSEDDDFLATDEDDDTIIVPLPSDDEDDDSDYDSEDDDSEMMYDRARGKSSVVIEEIQEDDKPAVGGRQKGSNKKKNSENVSDSKLQLVVRTPAAESLESEDEDGFPKKSAEGSSKKKEDLNNEKSSEDKKRKISDHSDSPGEVKAENDRASKKKKKTKAKKTAADSEEKASKQQDSPAASTADAKQKEKKNKDKSILSNNDAEEVTEQEGKKKKNKKKKTQEKNTSENQTPTDGTKSESKKQQLQTRTFANGMIIQQVAMGKPDGKKAVPGKKVSVKYIGKLKNGTIFDSTVGRSAFDFRLGVGQVIKGWESASMVCVLGTKESSLFHHQWAMETKEWGRYHRTQLSCLMWS